MELTAAWLIGATLIAVVASARGRSFFGWFIFSIVLSPLLGLIMVALLPSVTEQERPTPDTHVKCPDCRELVLKEARVCKHCGCRLVPQPQLA